MGKRIKAQKSGESCKFISRAKAIRKLQVSLKDFRRLCILKGVYPREPPKKLTRKNLTYYHIKDINFLEHDKIVDKFREMKSHMKKIKKARARNLKEKEKKLIKNSPKVTLNHLVKERYPTFTDALRDLDDPLCLINLFAGFHAHKDYGIPREKIEACIKLQREFNLYVIKAKALKKVFLSIKGIYYQAEIQGQNITWIQPYQLPPNLPIDVDYKVMLTFLEFYETLMKFINFRLFNQLNVKYPLDIDSSIENQNHFCYKAFIIKNNEGTLFDQENEKYKIDEKFQSEMQQKTEQQTQSQNLFKNLVFFLSTEVPKYSLEFVILSFGGEVYWAGDESGIKFDDKKITHYVTDRKPEQIKILKNREYVQPQWIYDSLNSLVQLPIKDYAPGKILPPHLSPFNNDNAYYKTDREKEINKLQGKEEQNAIEEEDDMDIKAMLEEEQNKVGESEEEESGDFNGEEVKEIEQEEEDDEEEDVEEEEEEEEENEEEEESSEEESSEEEEEEEDDEQLSSEVVDEVEGGDQEGEDEEQYDHEEQQVKKSNKQKQTQKENRDLAKNMMSKKQKTLYRKMQHQKEQQVKEAFKLQAKKERVTRKNEFLNKRKNVKQ